MILLRSYSWPLDTFRCAHIQNAEEANRFGHAMREELCGTRWDVVADPATKVMAFDSRDLKMNATGDLDDMPSIGRGWDGENSVLFVDGHYQWVKSRAGLK